VISRNDSTGDELDAVTDSSLKERSKFVEVVVVDIVGVVVGNIAGYEKDLVDVVAN